MMEGLNNANKKNTKTTSQYNKADSKQRIQSK